MRTDKLAVEGGSMNANTHTHKDCKRIPVYAGNSRFPYTTMSDKGGSVNTHTPGPWRRSGGLTAGYSIIGADNSTVAENIVTHDAHLIAAAPDLLEALADLLDACPTSCDDRRLIEAQRAAEAAIAKAQGAI